MEMEGDNQPGSRCLLETVAVDSKPTFSQCQGVLTDLGKCQNDLSKYFRYIRLESSLHMSEWELILNRSGRQDWKQEEIEALKICARHRHELTEGWHDGFKKSEEHLGVEGMGISEDINNTIESGMICFVLFCLFVF